VSRQAGAAIRVDDTPVPVGDPGRGKTTTRHYGARPRRADLETVRTPAAAYLYPPDRKGEHAKALLGSSRLTAPTDTPASTPFMHPSPRAKCHV